MKQFVLPQSICRFAVARRDVTPPVGIYHRMWGAARHDTSRGVHRRLTATALLFQSASSDSDVQAVIALDHCLLFHSEVRQIIQRICDAAPIPSSQILLAFSHTHAAGLMDPQRASMEGGELISPYLNDLADSAASAVEECLSALQPSTISYAAGRCSLAANRDYWDEDRQQFVCGFNPGTPADDTVIACRVAAEDGTLLATIVNYGCHPTTLAWDNQLISPDFPGAMREVVEQQTEAPCVFLQGASGDLGPRDGFVGETEIADKNGRQLGFAALSALESLPPPRTKYVYSGPVVSGATLGVWEHQELSASDLTPMTTWQAKQHVVNVPYQESLPDLEQTKRDFEDWQQRYDQAVQQQDEQSAAEARAMVERMRRWSTRLKHLPAGDHFPYPVTLWKIGPAIWLAVDGEPYNLLQTELRSRFPHTPIVVMVLANGSRAWYLPNRDTYGTGIYQESMANLCAGSLEQIIDNIADEIRKLDE